MQIVMKNVFEWGHMVGDADREVLANALIDASRKLTSQPPKEIVVYQTPEDELDQVMTGFATATVGKATSENVLIVFTQCSIENLFKFVIRIINGLIYFLQFKLIFN